MPKQGKRDVVVGSAFEMLQIREPGELLEGRRRRNRRVAPLPEGLDGHHWQFGERTVSEGDREVTQQPLNDPLPVETEQRSASPLEQRGERPVVLLGEDAAD